MSGVGAENAAADLARVIAGVTDLWDEPLDEVHDIPQIVNAILAAGWTRATSPKGVALPREET